MANLNETPKWEEEIYQLEMDDPVMGGPDGVDNSPHKQLANRTRYLKQKHEELAGTVAEQGENIEAIAKRGGGSSGDVASGAHAGRFLMFDFADNAHRSLKIPAGETGVHIRLDETTSDGKKNAVV